MRRAAVFVLLAGLLTGLAAAQPPAKEKGKGKDKKDAPPAATAPPPAPLPNTDGIVAEEKSFNSVDGVKLRGLFYKSAKGGSGPVVVLLHEFKKDPNESRWDGTAKLLAAGGFNAFRFAFRGHGEIRNNMHSRDIAPEEFFAGPYSGINKAQVRGAANPATKNLLDAGKDLPAAYEPMLVQDLAAVRTLLDQMNDAGECNTSSIYLLGAGSTVNVGFLFLASEWHRERERVRTFFGVVPPVSARRGLIGDVGAAGQDYAGAVWLGPTTDPSRYPTQTVKGWVEDVSQLKLRNETPMLFLYGAQDAKGKAGADAYFNTVLRANVKASGGGSALPKLPQTFKQEVKGTGLAGSGLLGAAVGTEQTVLTFLTEVEKERKNKPRKSRDFEKPLYVDVQSFGVLTGN